MKIIVYAICKNEEKFAARWAVSMGEADGIYVLDTGSTDKTAEILRQNTVYVDLSAQEEFEDIYAEKLMFND